MTTSMAAVPTNSNANANEPNAILQIIKTARAEEETSSTNIVLDISTINSLEDLDTLAKQDAFMYHSIPAVYMDRLLLSLSRQHSEMMIPPVASSSNNTNTNTKTTMMISRKSRVSTECDSISLLRQDIMIDDDDDIEQEVNSVISRSQILEDGFLGFTAADSNNNNNIMPGNDPTSVLDFDSKFGCSDVSEFDLMDLSSLLV